MILTTWVIGDALYRMRHNTIKTEFQLSTIRATFFLLSFILFDIAGVFFIIFVP
jgi:hypothetical protein